MFYSLYVRHLPCQTTCAYGKITHFKVLYTVGKVLTQLLVKEKKHRLKVQKKKKEIPIVDILPVVSEFWILRVELLQE